MEKQFDENLSETEFDRLGVITLQGGGVYGLTLLGQLQTIHYKHRIVPVALAGTSAGAIIATLYWAGMTPNDIRDEFVRMADQNDLLKLLGPFEPKDAPFTFQSLRGLLIEGKRAVEQVRLHFRRPPDNRSHIGTWVTVLLAICRLWPHFRCTRFHYPRRGIFTGYKLEVEIDSLLRRSRIVGQLPGLPPQWTPSNQFRPLTFGDIYNSLEQAEKILPTLFLTSTNVSTRRLRLFSSIDERDFDIPVARAARVSAGFPLFFRPVELCHGENEWYVDGGVISNFPLWVFGSDFRKQMSASDWWRNIALRPWVHIGLRRGAEDDGESADCSDPATFLNSLVTLLTGNARDELELIISRLVQGPRIISQPLKETGGPPRVLDVDALDGERVRTMVRAGAAFAQKELRQLSFAIPRAGAATEIRSRLKLLVQKLGLLLLPPALPSCDGIRATVFLATGNRLVRCYHDNIGSPVGDIAAFPLEKGLTGLCFVRHQPLVCNLRALRELANTNPDRADGLFEMTAAEHQATRTDWLVSVPIFDPVDFSAAREQPASAAKDDALVPSSEADNQPPTTVDPHEAYFRVAGTRITGVIYGVLNVDAILDPQLIDPGVRESTGPRTDAIVELTVVTAYRLGEIFGKVFGRSD